MVAQSGGKIGLVRLPEIMSQMNPVRQASVTCHLAAGGSFMKIAIRSLNTAAAKAFIQEGLADATTQLDVVAGVLGCKPKKDGGRCRTVRD